MADSFDIPGAPAAELRRSPAAAAVGRLAAMSNLMMTHFEYRIAGTPPEDWVPSDREDLTAEADWHGGILREQKYQSFRGDLMIASFHPNHRAKWTAHELCHGLVGFAWQPDASPFFHATAARLAELLPVALFYFFDEAGLQRCEEHRGFGPLFATFCPACEAAAHSPKASLDAQDERYLQDGRAFVERELAAVQRGLRLGRPVASPWGNLDLCSDGMAYAAAQGPRLMSRDYADFMALAYPDSRSGCHRSLADLTDRLLAVMKAILGEGEAPPWPVSRDLWKARDVAWRLWELAVSCEAEPAQALRSAAADLLNDPSTIEHAIDTYEACHQSFVLPDPDDVFATGYPLPKDYGRSIRQIAAGLASACPMTWERLAETPSQRHELVTVFAAEDPWVRQPLGHRFAAWLSEKNHGLSDLATFEAAVNHAPPRDAAAWSFRADAKRDKGWCISSGVTVLPTTTGVLESLGITLDESAETPLLVVQRDRENEPGVLLPDAAAAELLHAALAGETVDADPDVLQQLFDQRILVPQKWSGAE